MGMCRRAKMVISGVLEQGLMLTLDPIGDVIPGLVAQTASFGAATAAGSGGWRPQLADQSVENITSYDELISGSLGSHTPVISSGRLTFTGAAGAPDGAVLKVTGASGREYRVTVSQAANTKHIASDADIDAAPGIAANSGLTLVIRQDAQISYRNARDSAAWVSSSSDTETESVKYTPITIEGEGAHIAGEHHLGGWRGWPATGTTFQDILLPNDAANAAGFLLEGNRGARNITVQRCTGIVDIDVDGAGDWSGGYDTTGLSKAYFVQSTNPSVENLKLRDNYVDGWFGHFDIVFDHVLEFVGNYMLSPYFDYRKTSRELEHSRRIEAFNFTGDPKPFSVNEPPEVEPHLDADQVTSGGPGALDTDQLANVVHHVNGTSFQSRFHADRASTATGGHRWVIRGDMQIVQSPHAMSNDWPDNVVIDRALLLPPADETMPMGSTQNRPLFGTSKSGDGGHAGTQRIRNSGLGPAASVTITPTVTETNVADVPGMTRAALNTALHDSAAIGALSARPSYADMLACFRPATGEALDGKSVWEYITAPSGAQSTTQISATYVPAPVLSALTVTDGPTGAFTVTSDIDEVPGVYWAWFGTDVTNPDHIRRGYTDSAEAVAYGYNSRGTAGAISCGGSAVIPDGTYYLCVASWNGPVQVTVLTQEVVVASASTPTFLGILNLTDYAAGAANKTFTVPGGSSGEALVFGAIGNVPTITRENGGSTLTAVQVGGTITDDTSSLTLFTLAAGTGDLTVDIGNSDNGIIGIVETDLTPTALADNDVDPPPGIDWTFADGVSGEALFGFAFSRTGQSATWSGIADQTGSGSLTTGGRSRYVGFGTASAGDNTISLSPFTNTFQRPEGLLVRFS